ncbi:MAG: RNA-binding protein [Calditrichae bacterium]|nr:RNA-binding protein [Calditrichota bacterium]MCB9057292.1 RNA-binding protein [Calditrichia bacterium]
MNIYVGNLPKSTEPDSVRLAFEVFGEVRSVNLIKDKYTKEARGFGFVEMPNEKEASEAIENLNGGDIGGRRMVVSEAKPRKEATNRYSFNYQRHW